MEHPRSGSATTADRRYSSWRSLHSDCRWVRSFAALDPLIGAPDSLSTRAASKARPRAGVGAPLRHWRCAPLCGASGASRRGPVPAKMCPHASANADGGELVKRTAVNPWEWSLQFGFNQGEVVEGQTKVLVCAGQTVVDGDGTPQHSGDMAAQIATRPVVSRLSSKQALEWPLMRRTPGRRVTPRDHGGPATSPSRSACSGRRRSERCPRPLDDEPGASKRSRAPAYLQPGSSTVWPGGWHLAPPSLGPLDELPGSLRRGQRYGAGVVRGLTHSTTGSPVSTAARELRCSERRRVSVRQVVWLVVRRGRGRVGTAGTRPS
jgi:hypothetical protein